MNKPLCKLDNRLRREPQELLAVVAKYFQADLGDEILAAFPVCKRPSLELLLKKLALVGLIAATTTYAIDWLLGIPSVGFCAGMLAAVIGLKVFSGKHSQGVVFVTAGEFVLIELQDYTFDRGQAIETIDRTSVLPEPRSHKGGVLGKPLPFASDGDCSWYYNALNDGALNDGGAGYVSLLKELNVSCP